MSDSDMTGMDIPDDIRNLLGEITDADRERLAPPTPIWNAIETTVAIDRDGSTPQPQLALVEPELVEADFDSIERRATTTMALARTNPSTALPHDAGPWRQWLPVAAAVAIAVAGGLVTWAFSDNLVEDPGREELVASTVITNDGLPVANDDTAEARLLKSEDEYVLEIDVPDLPASDGFYEVWIIDTNVEGMFSLGIVTGDGRYVLPPNVDPGDFPVVDISVEPPDGDPTHSGRSIWRGVLEI
jgi:anti-sigma-K factor RskA